MNVLLINPQTEGYTRSGTLPLGLLSIASYLKFYGHNVRLYDRSVESVSPEDVRSTFRADLVGVSLISYKALEDAICMSEAFRSSGVPVIWGGSTATALPAAVLKNECVDAVSLSEGEETWLALANARAAGDTDFRSISGLALRDGNGGVYLTPERPFLDLSTLPDLDWSFVDVKKYFQTSYGCKRMLYLYSAKGCPFSCSFCFNKVFHRCTYRKRPLKSLLREIRYLVENYGMDGVYFADELWCRSVREMHEICDALKGLKLDFVWGCQTRIGIFSREDFEYMFAAGCRWVFFGVESGSERILQAMNKCLALDKVEPTFAACKRSGIVAIGAFIVGYPGETPDDLRQTVALIERLDTTLISLNYFIVMPGSDIYYSLVNEGLYPEITDLHMLEKADYMERLDGNHSEVPTRDLKVVQSWYMWRSFLSNNVQVGDRKTSFTKKVVSDALRSVRGGTLKAFLLSVWDAGREFLYIAWYANAYPNIKKKYGIRKK